MPTIVSPSHSLDALFAGSCREVLPPWLAAQREVRRLVREPPPPAGVLRSTGALSRDVAEWIADWYAGPRSAPAGAVRASYRALEQEVARLSQVLGRDREGGGLGVRVTYLDVPVDPYAAAEDLCAELRAQRTMRLQTTMACGEPHPMLGSQRGGIADRLRVVHDVYGHAALGLGFDVQSEFATWLQCRPLFSPEARRAAFCELVGHVTTRVVTGERPPLRADLPPAALLEAVERGVAATTTIPKELAA